MKPPAPVSTEMRTEIARMPWGRIAAIKPPWSGRMTLRSMIGSPWTKGARTVAPLNFLVASGFELLVIRWPDSADFGPVLPLEVAYGEESSKIDVLGGDENLFGLDLRSFYNLGLLAPHFADQDRCANRSHQRQTQYC